MGETVWKGITARETHILIDFRFEGKRYQQALKRPPTPANMKYAQNLRNQVVAAINNGTFTFAEYFPDSKQAVQAEKPKYPLFGLVAQQWLESRKREITQSTYDGYQSIINCHFSDEYQNRIKGCIDPCLNDQVMAEITVEALDSFFASREVGNKRYNDVLLVCSMIFEYAVKAKKTTGVTENLVKDKKALKTKKATPDPLSPEEIILILEDMEKHYHEQIYIYFGLAFRMGFRPSEGIALKWSDIDWNRKEVKISRARTNGNLKALKTEGILGADEGEGRIVEIDDECIALLSRLRKHTQMQGEWLFLSLSRSRKGQPYEHTKSFVQEYWRPSLRRCKIRDRDARQTRHTCATMMLMAGADHSWAAKQLGHSIEMFEKVYSKWMPEVDNRRQLAKFSSMFQKPETLKLATKE